MIGIGNRDFGSEFGIKKYIEEKKSPTVLFAPGLLTFRKYDAQRILTTLHRAENRDEAVDFGKWK
jgi:hypothetical protein